MKKIDFFALLKNVDKNTLDKMFNYTISNIHQSIANYNVYMFIELDTIGNDYSVDEFYRLKFTVKGNTFYTKFTSYLNIVLCLAYFNDIIAQERFKRAMLVTQKAMPIFEDESVEIFSTFIKETFDELMEQVEKISLLDE